MPRHEISSEVIEYYKSLSAEENKSFYLWDEEHTGLGVYVSAKGTTSWMVQRWLAGKGGKSVRVVIGRYPSMTIVAARRQLEIERGRIANGEDISLKKRRRIEAERRILTASSVKEAFTSFLETKNVDDPYWIEVRRIFDKRVLPIIGEKTSILAVSKDDIRHLLKEHAKLKGTQRWIFTFMRPFFDWLVAEELLTQSPMATLKPPAPAPERDRVLNEDEITAFWKAAGQIDYFGPFYKLLLLTAQRRSEVAEMEWSEINGNAWTIPATKMKMANAHIVHLSQPALDILNSIKHRGSYVFTHTGETPIQGFGKANKELYRLMGDPDHFTLHDLRRTAATGMAGLGHLPHVVDKVLAHVVDKKVRRIYQRFQYLNERKQALDTWAGYIMKLEAK